MGINIQVIRTCPRSASVRCHSMSSIVCCCAQQKLTGQASPSTFTTKASLLQRTETNKIRSSARRGLSQRSSVYDHGFQSRSPPSMACHVRNLPYLPSYPDFCTAQFQGLFFMDYRPQPVSNSAPGDGPNYQISIAAETQGLIPRLKKKKNPTRLSDRTVCSG